MVARVVSALYFCGVGDREVKQFMNEAADARSRSELLEVVTRWVTTLAVVLAVLPSLALAEPQSRTFHDSMGREVGRADRSGNSTVYRDSQGRQTGRSERRPDDSTIFFNERGERVGTSKEPRR